MHALRCVCEALHSEIVFFYSFCLSAPDLLFLPSSVLPSFPSDLPLDPVVALAYLLYSLYRHFLAITDLGSFHLLWYHDVPHVWLLYSGLQFSDSTDMPATPALKPVHVFTSAVVVGWTGGARGTPYSTPPGM